MNPCICGKTKPFAKCCGRYLSGKQVAKTPEQLMRSRFSAFALGGYGEYLLSTWLPATSKGLTVPELSQKSVNWQSLEVISSSQTGDKGEVEFKARFYQNPSSNELEEMHEISEFVRIKSRWLYVGARIK